MYNIANLLTFSRIALIPIIAVLILVFPDNQTARMAAFILYAICGITDFLDGWIARKYNLHSNLGRMLDPIADKLLIAVVLLILTELDDINGIHVIPAIIILCREFLVSGLREFLGSATISMPVTNLAKWKTTLQIFSLGFFVIGNASGWISPAIPAHFIGLICLWCAAILTVYTGYIYLKSGLAFIINQTETDSRV
jgi:CDP-diacylglycerol--glycerol-3-phosphate 3-phosphatidyltransferase